MRNSFVFYPINRVVYLALFTLICNINLIGQCDPGTIKGKVFVDANFNGTIEGSEEGKSGVFVRAYNANGAIVAQSITNSNGEYTIPGLNDGQDYLVSFDTPDDYSISAFGPDNGTEIQFSKSPNCEIDFGILNTTTDCSNNSEIILSCFVNGVAGDNPDQETLIGITHDFNASSPVTVYATKQETGSVWGMAYDKGSNQVFSAAFVKQHASLTAHGHDAIFNTSLSGSPVTNVFAKLSDLGQAVGTLSVTDLMDCEYGKQVGKYGLGGLTIDDDGNYLYVANLYNNTIVGVDIDNPIESTTKSFAVPNPGCSFNDFRVFALKYYNGKLYVGVTCTAETSLDEEDTSIHVFSVNVNTGSFDLEFSTDYSSGVWVNDNSLADVKMQWLTDIDFSDEGNMLIAISDRKGHSYCKGVTSRVDEQSGDLLIVENLAGVWTLESNGSTSSLSGTGIGNGEGPDGGEFFGDDFFPKNQDDHSETSLGSIVVVPSTGDVVSAVFDPQFNSYSGGMHRYNTSNGQKVGSKELYNNNISAYFGKATGFGDLVAICGTLDVEIGNLVWHDANCDGLQNANEEGIAGLPIQLYDDNCNLVANTTTDSQGRYAFNRTNVDLDSDGTMDGLNHGAVYYLTINTANYDKDLGSYLYNDVYYFPTLEHNDDLINSDLKASTEACIVDQLEASPSVLINTVAGNTTSHDIGLKESTEFDLALTKRIISNPNIKLGDDVIFEIKVINQGGRSATEFELTDYLTDAYSFNPADNPGWILSGNKIKKLVSFYLKPSLHYKENLTLQFIGSNNTNDFVNYAEISSARNHLGEIAVDMDSTPDDDPSNDKGGTPGTNTDDLITDDGTLDEDDHDPAELKVMDLALKNVVRDNRLYDVDEYVVFDMTIYNQGNVSVESFEVTNMFPDCMTFEFTENLSWTAGIPGFASTVVNEELLPGENTTVSLKLKINSDCDYADILNIAEISSMTSSVPGLKNDIDSDADGFLFNDKGGDPYDFTDNLITDDGTLDEDDHDPAVLSIRKIDLALMKTTDHELYELGDQVEFEIKIYNQGDVSMGTVMIVDYLPENTSITDNSWTMDVNDPSGRTFYKTIDFENGFNPGDEHTETITLRIEDTAPVGQFIINEAEIASVRDMFGVDVSEMDIDSHADSDANNDMGGEYATVTDDNIYDNGTMDEDDHDPSGFFIADIELTQECVCLNDATEPYNGLFQATVVITSISGQDWYIDELNNLYDVSSTAGNLMGLATGQMGYTLSEFVLPGNLSEYVFTGVFEDSERYNIRFTNGFGTYLQAEGGGPNCSYNRPVISSNTGLSAVCTGSSHTYTVDYLYGCGDFDWDLTGGGVIIPSMNPYEVTVVWDNEPGGPYTLSVVPNCGAYCVAPVFEDIQVGSGGLTMSCRDHVNVSLNSECAAHVDASAFLTSTTPPGVVYQLMLIDDHGNTVANNYLTEEYLWETLTAKVIDPCTGNSCWSTLDVEDKMAPQIQCGSFELPCFLMNTYEPLVLDNCTDASYKLISETIEPYHCDPDYIKEVTRVYVSIDGYGNESAPCEQVISLERVNFDEIVPPNDFLLSNDTNLTCIDSIYNEDGELDYHITGTPELNGHSIFPLQDVYCNVAIEYEDFVVVDFGCVRKVMRTWRIYEHRCTIGEVWTYVQTIEVVDTDEPLITCPSDITVSSGGGPGCEASVLLELPTIEDDCSTEFVIDMSYAGGLVEDVQSAQIVTIEAGTHDVTFNVYDECENLSSCDVNVTVLDERPPVAVCDENTVVSLRSDGTAKAFADTFDDGSYDDCSLLNTLVKRVDSPCDCVRPKFEDMHYLGEYNGRFYYLSKFLTHGSKAFLYSEAYGGMLLTLESEGEADWVYDRTREFITSSYYIGLSDSDHQGQFTWYNHEEPSFDNWGYLQPTNVGDHVITTSKDEWVVVDGNEVEAYYVMELSDPCSYSDEVVFCCEDTAEEQMVIFRAIDYFGRVNECMVRVEVQDKVAPEISCPQDYYLSCEVDIDLDDLSAYGFATASDQCSVEIREEVIDERNDCGFGDIIRRFYAEDNNGYSTCDQILTFSLDNRFDNNTIIWPLDFDTDLGCNSGELHPDSLDELYARPQYELSECANIAVSFDDQTFDFSGSNGSDACLKILRRWTVIDWCQMNEKGYEPATHEQVIKVTNTVGPDIMEGCDSLVINTFECDYEDVVFTSVAHDDCTPDEDLNGKLLIDLHSDGNGVFDMEENVHSNVISFDGELPVGNHFALISFSDQCGNTTTCTKIIQINNIKGPTAACIDGLSVALEPMDLDNDGEFDTEMACITPDMLDASSTHTCGVDFTLSFSADPADTIKCFDCDDLGINLVQLWVIDIFGNTDYCEIEIDVQDNNMQDHCPRFDLALTKKVDTLSTPGPYMQGSDISYNIEIINQGNIPAFNIEIIDYIPDGLILTDSDWEDKGNGTAEYLNPIEFLDDSTSTTITIDFMISPDFMGLSIENTAEILFADNDEDPNNEDPEDGDSTFDDMNDDNVGEDNAVNNENNDEDDHDPEEVDVEQVFDLELTKECANGFDGPFSPGSMVNYEITITNNGTLDAHNVQISDVIPAGMELVDAEWQENAGIATLNIPIPIVERGTSVTVGIMFFIEEDFMGNSITNTAEIIDPNNEFPIDDIDSSPGNDDGDQSEDDEDFKTISVDQVFDLALTKVIDSSGTVFPIELGTDVSFLVTVYNQGSLDATDIRVMDYVPEGFVFDPAKNSDFGVAGSNAVATVPFVAIDSYVELELVLTLEESIPSPMLVNNAEITEGTNALGYTDQDDDLSNTNDGSTNELATDNDIDDERPSAPGTMDNPNDEDDYDPALVEVFCPPTAVCQNDITLALDENGELTITTGDIDGGSFDSCGQDFNLSLAATEYDCDSLGQVTVVLTVSVDSGLSDECEASVTIVDNTNPVAACQDITVSLGADGAAVITEDQIENGSTDACNDLSFMLDITEFDCEDMDATNIVVLTVSDGSGNSDTCSAEVTVEDNMDPSVICVGGLDVDLGGDGMATVTIDQYIMDSSDNCGVVMMDATDFEFSCEDISLSPVFVTVTVYDEAGNSADCSVGVNVMDNEAPTCDIGPSPGILIDAETLITLDDLNYDVDDNCSDSVDIVAVIDPMMFPCDSVGMFVTVTVTVTDESGNSSTCTTEVEVVDDTTPVCIAQDLEVFLDANGEAEITPEQVDNGSTAGCDTDPDLSLDITMFNCGDVPSQIVTLTVSANGQESDCTATITVTDNIDPEIACVDDFTVSLVDDMVMISTGDIIASSGDNCGIMSSTIDMSMFDCDDDGETFTITATVTDDSGNTATCTTDVTVDDDTAPVCNVISDLTVAPNQVIELDDLLDPMLPFFEDNCADMANTVDIDPTVFDCMMLGAQVVVVTVTDESDNSATCFTNVLVEDLLAPVCLAMDITVSLDSMGNYFLTPDEVDDGSFGGCAEPLMYEVNPDFFACNDVDLSPVDVVLTVTDQNMVSSTCVAEVTVVDDIAPVITCEPALTLDLDMSGNAVITVGDIVLTSEDGCGIDSEELDITMFDCDDKMSVVVVTATVTDDNGNTTTCQADISVEDNMAPTCTLLPDLTFAPEVLITPDDVLDNFSDNCATSSASSQLVPDMFTCNDLGEQVVTLTVDDGCGNTATCEGTIEIVDVSVPTCVAMDITVSLNGNGVYSLDGEEVDGGSSAACGSNLEFEVDPNFFDCGDLGDNVVTLTVTATGGATDECTATVTVQDTLAPVIVCPAAMMVPCETDISNPSDFGDPMVTDNCDMGLVPIEDVTIDVNACNVGTLERLFTVTDNSGNVATCMQIVTISGPANPLVESMITWPISPFDAGDCIPDPNNINSGTVMIDTSTLDCFNISVTSNDVVTGDAQCDGVIERTWTVTDSCQAPGGVFTFTQLILVNDVVGPDVDGPMDMVIILPPSNMTCDTFLNLPATVTDCTGGFTATNDSPYAITNDTEDASGTYPVGETVVNITATDVCGNDSIYTYTINVVDTTGFILDCSKIIDNITMNLDVVIDISQAQAIVDFGDCNSPNYELSFSNTMIQDTIIATCSDVGFTNYTIYLWTGGMVIDSCTNLLQIVDGGGFCTSPLFDGTIVGTVSMEDQRLVDGVSVDLNGSPFEQETTDSEGSYAFPTMPFGGQYEVVPVKDIDHMNGVSTLDLVAIQKHILGTEYLDSPYKLIAADIDRSGSITGSDLLELRKLILGVYQEFPNNTSWRMIDKSYKFIDPLDPFVYEIPEIYEIFNFNQSMIIDFVGVKVGDVNNSAIANANDSKVDSRSNAKFFYQLDERTLEASDLVEIEFSSDDIDLIDGIQHSIKVDPELARLIDVKAIAKGINDLNFFVLSKEEGIINFSWNGEIESEESDVLFSIIIEASTDAWVSDIISIDQEGLRAEAYYGKDYTANVDIEFVSSSDEIKEISLYQNVPNPWVETTEIKFYMPTKDSYSINIYDINGRLIHAFKGESRLGMNKLELDKELFETGGIIYYELISQDVRLVNKMLLVK